MLFFYTGEDIVVEKNSNFFTWTSLAIKPDKLSLRNFVIATGNPNPVLANKRISYLPVFPSLMSRFGRDLNPVSGFKYLPKGLIKTQETHVQVNNWLFCQLIQRQFGFHVSEEGANGDNS